MIQGWGGQGAYKSDKVAEGPLMHRMPRMSTQLRAISLEYSYAELTAATLNWHASRRLGSGSYGAVYKGELEDGFEVAIKVIDLGALGASGQGPEMAGFDDEIQMLSKFRHPNLVTLLGWGKQNLQRYLVYELLAGGDAFQRLLKSKQPGDTFFHWHERLSVCLDAATGLSHMHNSKPKAFHRDIKSANILLDRHGTAKMADFGLSCTSGTLGDLHVTVKTIRGTPGYACPIYSRTGRVTEGSEVYSLGMVMLEFLTGLAPATADPQQPGGIAYQVGSAVAPGQPGAIDRCMRCLDGHAGWPPQLSKELGLLALRCVNEFDESQRPHFVEIVRTLRNMSERFPVPSASFPGGPYPPQIPQTPPHLMRGLVVAGPPCALVHGAATPAPPQAGTAPQHGGTAPVNGTNTPQIALLPQPMSAHQQQVDVASQAAPHLASQAATAGEPHFRGFDPSSYAGPHPAAAVAGRASLARDADVHGGPCQSAARPVAAASFFLELVTSAGLDADALSPDQGRLPLLAGPPVDDGTCLRHVAPVGRQHQPDFFEAWLRHEHLRSCISRTAFEVSWTPQGENVQLLVHGSNPVSVDGKIATRAAYIPLRLGSEIGFVYSLPAEANNFLVLRFSRWSAAPAVPASAGAVMYSRSSELANTPTAAALALKERAPGLAGAAHALAARSPPTASTHEGTRFSQTSTASTPSGDSFAQAAQAPPATDDRAGRSVRWCLTCVHAEGLSAQALMALPPDTRSFEVGDGCLYIGRQHQPHVFEALLMAAPTHLTFISRTHVQIEWHAGGGLTMTNMSSNSLYVDQERVAKGESRALGHDQIVSFARPEGGTHVNFLAFQVRAVEVVSVAVEAAPPRQVLSVPDSELLRAAPGSIQRPVSEHELPAAAAQGAHAGRRAGSPMRRPGAETPPAQLVAARQPGAAMLQREASAERLRRSAASSSYPPRLPSPAHSLAEVPETYHIVLELHGEGVLNIPSQQRRIGPVSLLEGPLLVGRRHQPELHQRAIARECLQFLSRDHFCITLEGNQMRILVLTSNPIWQDRDGESPKELKRGDVVQILSGDRIALGTGGAPLSANDVCRNLCWHLSLVSRIETATAGAEAEGPAHPTAARSASNGRSMCSSSLADQQAEAHAGCIVNRGRASGVLRPPVTLEHAHDR